MPSSRVQAEIGDLWDALADYDASDCERALRHLLAVLARLVDAQNAWWLAVIRVGDARDPVHGWRPATIQYLHESTADRQYYRENDRRLARGSVDQSSVASMRQAGTFRVLWLPELVDAAWYHSEYYQIAYKARGIGDAMFVGCPVNRDAESFFGFHRKLRRRPFGAGERAVLEYALRGLRWFHRRLFLSHGLLVARQRLTPTERRVLHHLLTELPEARIAPALGLATPTTHNHITSIYRKFGVRSRAALMALWLGRVAS